MTKKKKILWISLSSVLAFILICCLSIFVYYLNITKPNPVPLSLTENQELQSILEEKWGTEPLQTLYWKNAIPHYEDLYIYAQSAILLDTATGTILFEKNADDIIPPASMMKLVVMYVVFQEIATGRVSLDDVVPLPRESWAINAPPNSSLMFLAEGQRVTLRELLLGLAIASGNDAAVAVAHYISGSVDTFVERMNEEMKLLGLEHTHFVEPSGYDENNLTTPREFALFAKTYVTRYPESLTDFHSQTVLIYPREENLASWHKGQGDSQAITQYNTNKLLGVVPEVTGLKTGFIYESGYNLSLTAEKEGTSLLSITMGGPGQGSKEGNTYRQLDAETILDYGFSQFKTVDNTKKIEVPTIVLQGQKNSLLGEEARFNKVTVPNVPDKELIKTVKIDPYIVAPVFAGDSIGEVIYTYGDIEVDTIPLIADRTVDTASKPKRLLDKLIAKFISSDTVQ